MVPWRVEGDGILIVLTPGECSFGSRMVVDYSARHAGCSLSKANEAPENITRVTVAHVSLCHSRMTFERTYPCETQEMVFDAHDRGGACARHLRQHEDGGGDGLLGKDRRYNRRFLQMCSHYLVQPVAAHRWEKG